jgi:hypothetical protein
VPINLSCISIDAYLPFDGIALREDSKFAQNKSGNVEQKKYLAYKLTLYLSRSKHYVVQALLPGLFYVGKPNRKTFRNKPKVR